MFIRTLTFCVSLIAMVSCGLDSPTKFSGERSNEDHAKDQETDYHRNNSDDEGFYIRNGDEVFISAYPFAVSLYLDGTFRCSGSVVANNRILTAAHCLINSNTNQKYAASRFRVYTSKGYFNIASTTPHPEYINSHKIIKSQELTKKFTTMMTVDLGILTTTTNMGITPVQLASSVPSKGHELRLVGWGLDENEISNVLRTGTMAVDGLAPALTRNGTLKSAGIITLPNSNNQISCGGDSGSPVLNAYNQLVGVLAGGTYRQQLVNGRWINPAKRCHLKEDSYSVNIQPFEAWILNKIKPGQNTANKYDTTNDGMVHPIDPLWVINAIGRAGGAFPSTGVPQGQYLDVNGDGLVAPLDALQVINYLGLKDILYTTLETPYSDPQFVAFMRGQPY